VEEGLPGGVQEHDRLLDAVNQEIDLFDESICRLSKEARGSAAAALGCTVLF
jgi:hypothetical protein